MQETAHFHEDNFLFQDTGTHFAEAQFPWRHKKGHCSDHSYFQYWHKDQYCCHPLFHLSAPSVSEVPLSLFDPLPDESHILSGFPHPG